MSTLVCETITNGTQSITVEESVKASAVAFIRVNSAGTIIESFNISSVTENTNGNVFVCFFTNPMSNGNYAVVATPNTSNDGTCFVRSTTENSFEVVVRDYDGSIGNAGVAAVVYNS